ncbi:cytochrome-c peroxidase [Microbulbifer sp. 2205BS26-8]|uniref:cytochrome-c peroxidase n=1 Tax=Microbulbifer sp. 2205BS26-8 TaxID=3064386 RepID=UPI00273E4DC2|nr:cytochrome c peroxidase [Microbulbifer sp. 2205BS26-8]MDP5210912.1 cytochrome c peroxidase [Microbulbifer sp. 2205BS26-8]
MTRLLLLFSQLLFFFLLSGTPKLESAGETYRFTSADIAFLKRFTLAALPPLPAAPDNLVADNPRAAALGQRLFFDTRLSVNGQVACASCHQPHKYFTDGLPRSRALGTTRRNAPTILGATHSPWLFWDGRKDSLWSQALGPLQDSNEHGLDRLGLVRIIRQHYRQDFDQLFSNRADWARLKTVLNKRKRTPRLTTRQKAAVNRIVSQVGKAIMAYQRKLKLHPARFDRFVDQLQRDNRNDRLLASLMSADEVAGMRLFMGRANCASCHNGPLFTNYEFHNIGAPEADPENVDLGRYAGVELLQHDAFTCLSAQSDAGVDDCEEMRFLKKQGRELVGAFKTPTLRNVAHTGPYMHAGQFSTLEEVLAHYNRPTPPYYDRKQHPSRPHFDILPLGLDETQITQLIAFLETLSSPMPLNDPLWRAP